MSNLLSEERDTGGLAALHRAASEGEVDRCRALLHQGADANVRTGMLVRDGKLRRDWYWDPGDTPLILAAQNAHAATVRLLLEFGADATMYNANRWGPLHSAVVGGSSEVLAMLICARAEVNLSTVHRHFDEELGWFFGNTPLHVAASRNESGIARQLLEAGSEVASAWIDRRTPLIYAAARGSTSVVEVLCEYGADPNAREHRYEYDYFLDMTPLHYASRNGHVDTVAALLKNGAEPRAKESHSGLTAAEMGQESDFR